MKYINEINKIIINNLKKKKYFIFGQNILTGSKISGLSANLNLINKNKSFISNAPNSENSLIGMGFGVMMSGGNAIYFAKQLDFMLLGVDHFFNTFNSIKATYSGNGSFNIFLFVCDQGFQGPQSSFNNMDSFSSLSDLNTYQINTKNEANIIIPSLLKKKGFNIICLSQRMANKEIFEDEASKFSKCLSVFSYYNEKILDCSIICSNFSFEYALQLKKIKKNKKISILNINFVNKIDYNFLIHNLKYSKKIIIISDNKSLYSRMYKIQSLIRKKLKKDVTLVIRDQYSLYNNEDKLVYGFKKLKI